MHQGLDGPTLREAEAGCGVLEPRLASYNYLEVYG